MDLKLRLFATLRENRRKELTLSCVNGVTPKDIIHRLDIPEADVAILLVNGRYGSFDQGLSEKDVVSIFPPVGGG